METISSSSRTAGGVAQPHFISAPTDNATLRHGEGITGCCSVLSSVLRMQRSLTEVWSDLSEDTQSEGRTGNIQETYQSLVAKEDDETNDNRAAYQRFFVSVVDSTEKLDRLLGALDTPSRSNSWLVANTCNKETTKKASIYRRGFADRSSKADDEHHRARTISDEESDAYDCVTTGNTVQFNINEEAAERVQLAKTLRQLGGCLASDAGVIDLRAVAFWSLAKRERLWAEDEKLTRAEQTSLKSIRAMQVNHEEVDTVLGGRKQRIEDNMKHMQRRVEAQGEGWSEILLTMKDGVVRSRLHTQKRTHDILTATEERIAALKAELAESEHHVVGLNNESEDFIRAKNAYARKVELLQHIMEQQRARLEQISADLHRTAREAGSLDDSLQNITKLESAAEGAKGAVPSKEQNEGREKLQALVREEARRHREEQIQAITRRAGLLEMNKRLLAEVEKAGSALSEFQSPVETRKANLQEHQNEVEGLRAQVKTATTKLAQTERQLSQLSRKRRRTTATAQGASPPPTTKSERQASPSPSTPDSAPPPRDTPEEGSTPPGGNGTGGVNPQAWYQLEMLRAQHDVLVEDLERCDADDADDADGPGGGGGDDGGGNKGLHERTLLTAACWQLRDNGGSSEAATAAEDEEARRDGDAVLELAAVAVAADLTAEASGVAQKVEDALEWEGQAQPLEDKLAAGASQARWMYILRLAVELGQCDPSALGKAQQLLAEPPKPADLKGLYSTREDVHTLLRTSNGGPLHGGRVFSRLTESRGELTRLIDAGHARLARLNALLRALWGEPTGVRGVSSAERASALNDLIGVAIGESRLEPKLALRLFSALGNGVVGQARTGAEGVEAALVRDVASLRLTSKGALDERRRRAAFAATELCAVLSITKALAKKGHESLPDEVAQRGVAIQGELRKRIKTYAEPDADRRRHAAGDVLGAAEDFFAELPPEPLEHGPGASHLDLMAYLLGVVTGGCQGPEDLFNPGAKAEVLCQEGSASSPSEEIAPAQGDNSGVITSAGSATADKRCSEPATDRKGDGSERKFGHQLDGRGTLTEVLTKIASAMPCDPGHGLGDAWEAAQARITRSRGNEEVEAEAFELAIDAQVLEALKQSLLEALEAPAGPRVSSVPGDLPAVNTDRESAREATAVTEQAAGTPICLEGHAPLSGSEVDLFDESKTLQRKAEAVQFKNAMSVAARTGQPLQCPVQAGKKVFSVGALVATAKLAKRWKKSALSDGSGLDRQELERLNALLDNRIENLSAQLAVLEESKQAEKSMAKILTPRAAAEAELSPESWATREVQQLNARIRVHQERVHGVEMRLKDIRKGKSGVRDLETLWMSPGEREEMEANLRLISRKIAKANFALRTMRSRWDSFREKHRHLAPLVLDRLLRGHHAPAKSSSGEEAAVTLEGRERRPPSPGVVGSPSGG